MAKKKSTKMPRRDDAGNAETAKELYKDANARQRASQTGNMGRANVKPINAFTSKISGQTFVTVGSRAIRDAKAGAGNTSEARYSRLTGGGLRDLDK